MRQQPWLYFKHFKFRLGECCLSATRKGLFSLDFKKKTTRRGRNQTGSLAWTGPKALRPPASVQAWLQKAEREVLRYLQGERVEFRNLPVDWCGIRPFPKKVLSELRKVSWGETQTYQDLARKGGRPKAARAVGQILHRNRLPVIIPCHRVLPKKGGWGGFSKGVSVKVFLLKLEK